MLKLGLIGNPIAHSLSPGIYDDLMRRDGKTGTYKLFEMNELPSEGVKSWMFKNELLGINITIPFKSSFLDQLDQIDPRAQAIGAVNTVIREDDRLIGYNTDYDGIAQSLRKLGSRPAKAMVFGTGGASKAVQAVLRDQQIPHTVVGRSDGDLQWEDLTEEELKKHHWWINTTPVGTTGIEPSDLPLPFEVLTSEFSIFDLVYKPKITPLMRHGLEAEATVLGGAFMLNEQAEKAWEHFQAAYY